MNTWEEHKTYLYMPDDETQSLADVLERIDPRSRPYVEWLAASVSEMDDVVTRLRKERDLVYRELNKALGSNAPKAWDRIKKALDE